MKIEDPLGFLDAAKLSRLCEGFGLPKPEVVKALGPPRHFLLYGLRFSPQSRAPTLKLRIDRVFDPSSPGVDHEIAALHHLGRAGILPVQADTKRVADTVLGAPAALFPLADHSDGLRLFGLNPKGFGARLATDLGHTLRALYDHTVPRFGTRAAAGRFVPRRDRWSAEWAASVSRLHREAKAHGADLGPLSTRLVAAIEARLEALEDVDRFCLVHGTLRADSLVYDVRQGEPHLVSLHGLDEALWGDPLAEFGSLLTMSPAELGPVLAAFGRETVQGWLSDEAALARLELYHFTHWLARPARAAGFSAIGDHTGFGPLQLTAEKLAALFEPDAVRRHLEAALAVTDPAVHLAPLPSFDVGRSSLRAALSTLRGDASVPGGLVPVLLTGLGANVLTTQLGSASPASLREDGQRLAGALLRPGRADRTQPIEDRPSFTQHLVADLMQAAAEAPPDAGSLALMIAWLALTAIDLLDGQVSDAVLRGLETCVRELAIVDVDVPPGNDLLRLQHAVVGHAAVLQLAERYPVDSDHVAAIVHRLDHQLGIRLAAVGVNQPTQDFPDSVLLPVLTQSSSNQEQRLTRPLLVLALRALNGTALRADGPTLLRLMGG